MIRRHRTYTHEENVNARPATREVILCAFAEQSNMVGVYAAQPFPVISGYGCCRKRTHRDVVRTYSSSATMARSPPYINKTYMPSESLCYTLFIPRWPNAPVQHKNIHVRQLIINYVTHLTMGRGPPYIRKNYTYGNQSLSQSRVIVIQ